MLVVLITVSFLHIIAYLLQESVQLQHISLYTELTNLQSRKPKDTKIPEVLFVRRPRLSISYRYPTLSMQKVPLLTAEECGKAFIQLRHSAVGKEETPHMLRA